MNAPLNSYSLDHIFIFCLSHTHSLFHSYRRLCADDAGEYVHCLTSPGKREKGKLREAGDNEREKRRVEDGWLVENMRTSGGYVGCGAS